MPTERPRTGRPQPLTSTKLDPPPLQKGLIDRPDLLQRLTASAAPLVLIGAPAGWGKSSVLAAWSESADEHRSFAFLRLGSEDNEPRAFWSYVVAAIYGGADGAVPADIAEALAAPGTDSLRALVPSLINNLNDSASSTVLALDDYHHVTDPAIHRSVEYLVENAPRSLQIAIASRSDPPLTLARWRAAGLLEEVRLADLRLSTNNTADLLHSRFGLAIESSDAELLCQRTEGWPAGIQLAGVSMAGDPDPTEFIRTFAGNDRNIGDYLTNEVLQRQPAERSTFLQETSLLDGITAELCDYVLDTHGSSAVLEEIERENLFLVPLDSKREWFRYHHLFQDWLNHNLRIRSDPQRIVELHTRAADWLLRHGLEEQALGHFLGAGNVHSAAEIVEQLLSRLAFIHEGPVRHWLSAIPHHVAAGHPRICIAHLARCLTVADYEGARAWFTTLDTSLATASGEEQEELRPHVNVYRALYALPMLDLERAEQGFRAVVEDETHRGSAPAAYARGLLGLTLFWLSGPTDALPHLREGSLDRRQMSMGDTGITAYLAAAYAELGEWDHCKTAVTDAFALPAMSWTGFPDTMPAHYAKGRLLHHQGLHAEAADEVERGLEQAKAWTVPAYIAWGYLVMSDVATSPAEKRRLLMEAEMHGGRYSSDHYLNRAITKARQHIDATWPIIAADGAIVGSLTRREIEVLRLLRSDLSLRDIGSELNITLNTAKGYTKNIYQKLAVNSRPEAVTVATEAGVI